MPALRFQARAIGTNTKNNITSSSGLGSRRMIFQTMMLMDRSSARGIPRMNLAANSRPME